MNPSRNGLKLLRLAMAENDSIVCCGLDPDISKIPNEFLLRSPAEDALRAFLWEVIELTASHVCAYKAQKAFFDIHPEGHRLLQETVAYIHHQHPGIPVFIDAKIGDIENTMETYLRNIFGELEADGVVVNPYMGDDVFRPFGRYPDKAVIVTVRTSNSSASVTQNVLLQDGRPYWRYILDLAIERWNVSRNIVPVITSTVAVDLGIIRQVVPDDMPVLFAGYGTQGGTAENLRELVNSAGRGVFVNSSRGLLYPYGVYDNDWREKIVNATMAMKNELNLKKSRTRFLLLLGVSGAGKSALIRELHALDERYGYISPFMTRPPRPGETGKISVTDFELSELERTDKILAVNELYGTRYATPREPIENAFRKEAFPILDWPIERMELMQAAFPRRLFTVYVEPPDLDTLEHRLADGRDMDGKRFEVGKAELTALASGIYDGLIDYRVITTEGAASVIARSIHNAYLRRIGF